MRCYSVIPVCITVYGMKSHIFKNFVKLFTDYIMAVAIKLL